MYIRTSASILEMSSVLKLCVECKCPNQPDQTVSFEVCLTPWQLLLCKYCS